MPLKYRIINIHRHYTAPGKWFATLVDEKGRVEKQGTLEYILKEVETRGLELSGDVKDERNKEREL